MHPFSIHDALAARHAQHVVLIHFPIALFLAGVAFDLLALRFRRQEFSSAAYCNFCGAALFALPVVATGVLAWQWALDGAKLKGVLLLHLALGITSAALILLVWLLRFLARRKAPSQLPGSTLASALPRFYLPLELLAAFIITLTGHLGGFLSGVNS